MAGPHFLHSTFCILRSAFGVARPSSAASRHLLPAGGEKDLTRDPSPREAGRGWREAPGEGLYVVVAREAVITPVSLDFFTGSLMTMLVPMPSSEATVTSPPCASTICLTM